MTRRLQNWGNAVRIRHADGSTAWYFHIQTNGVLVKKGDKVQRGQPIATADNTGRSTRRHLHFQVQASSADWGQSIPITFEIANQPSGSSCKVPLQGQSVLSNNSNPNYPP